MVSGPVIIGFDGSPASRRAVRESARLLGPRPVLVVTVWEAGRAFELATLPMVGLEMPAATLDIAAATELDRAMYESAQQTAEQGAALANEAGFQGEALVIADEMTVADTLIRLAKERDAPGIVVAAHGRAALAELFLGSTTRGVLKHAPCPVVVVHNGEDESSAKP
jgi:nucleotide-binding universal stress UspA family protein